MKQPSPSRTSLMTRLPFYRLLFTFGCKRGIHLAYDAHNFFFWVSDHAPTFLCARVCCVAKGGRALGAGKGLAILEINSSPAGRSLWSGIFCYAFTTTCDPPWAEERPAVCQGGHHGRQAPSRGASNNSVQSFFNTGCAAGGPCFHDQVPFGSVKRVSLVQWISFL